MDFNATIDLIIKDLEEAREIIDDLKKYKDVPAFQVEIAKSKCKSAAEIIALLKNMSIGQAPEKEKNSFKEEVQQPVVQDQIHDEVQDLPEPVSIAVPIETDNDEDEILPDFKPGIKKDESSVKRARARILDEEIEDDRKKTSAREPDPEIAEIQPIESKAKNEVNTVQPVAPQEFINEVELKRSTIIADRFRKQDEDDFSGIMKTRPLTSLSDAIGINDSFYYIREIFNGNKLTYSEALLKLEKAESLKDARAVIMSYTGQKADSEASLQLLDLVKRKLLLHG